MRIPDYLRNKYIVASAAFVLWMLIFHDADVFYVFKMRSELSTMKAQCEDYRERNAMAHEALSDLSQNMRSLEKFAREHYFMKKENEDLFVIYDPE